jgi:predicted N-acetyltransferase YhbS
MIIRTENKQDFDSVYELNLQAFKQIEEPELVDKLRESDRFIPELSLVALIGKRVVGYILFTKIFIQSEGINKESLALAPMAVLPEMQKEGVGKELIRFGIDSARKLGYESIVVLGHADYYPKFGFTPASKFGIVAPWKVPDEVFMVLELKDNALKSVSGLVNYAQAFMDL